MNEERKGIMSGQHPAALFVFSSLGVIVIGFVFQILGMLLASLFFDVSIFDLSDLTSNARNEVVGAMKLLQIVGALGTFVFSSFLLSFLYTGKWTGFFPFGKKLNLPALLLLVIIMITALPFVNMLTELNMNFKLPFDKIENYLRNLEDQTESLMMVMIQADTIGALMVNLFMIALIPAIGEELVFRGLIQKHLSDLFRNPHIGVLLASVIFSLAHFQVYSFLPRFFLGMILGYTFVYGKSIWYPMVAHLVNNGFGVLFYYFYNQGKANESLEEIGTPSMLPMAALASILLVAGMMFVWVKMMKANQIHPGVQVEKDSPD